MDWTGLGEIPQIDVTVPSQAALIDDIRSRLADRRGFSVATLNLDHVVKLRSDPNFRAAYVAHSHVTADGNPIVWMTRLAGRPVSLVPGSELIWPVLEVAAALDVPVGLFGSDPATLQVAAARMKERLPALSVVFTEAPPMGFDPNGEAAGKAIDALAESGARICFLALGAPKQEMFAARAQERLRDVGFLSVGAGIDFITGRQRRAPKLVRMIAAEWLWRLAANPGQLAARYARCLAVLPGLFGRALSARGQRNPTARAS